jgi:hypothetical protein
MRVDPLGPLLGVLKRQVAARLWGMMVRLRNGQDTDIRTPLFDEAPRDQIVEEWSHRLGSTGFE